MASNSYIGISGAARKVKSIYVGVDGKARKVKKGYVGVNGLARLFFSGGGELSKYGTAAALSTGRYYIPAATVGNYALFVGGQQSKVVDAYDTSLTRSTPTALSTSGSMNNWQSIAAAGDYVLFNVVDATVCAYNTSLTRSTPTALSRSNIRGRNGAASVGGYALFAGGYYMGTSVAMYVTDVNAYNASLTRSIPTALSIGRIELAGAAVGDYALFAGGRDNNSDRVATVDVYNKSLTRSAATLPIAVDTMVGATVGNYALFTGGFSIENPPANYSSWFTSRVTAYNASLTRSTPTALSGMKADHDATTVGDFALFAGGKYDYNSSAYLNTVDAYNASLTRSTPTALSSKRVNLSGATVGDYALFAGGADGTTYGVTTVEVYQVK